MFELENNEKLYYEDQNVKYFINDNTKSLTEYIQKDNQGNGNKGLKDYFILLAKSKIDDLQEYIILNNLGQPIYCCGGYEAAAVQIDILQFRNTCKRNGE